MAKGFLQGIVSYVAERASKWGPDPVEHPLSDYVDFSLAAEMSPEGGERGLSWNMSEIDTKRVQLMHRDKDIAQLMCGEEDPVRRDIVMPPVEEFVFIEAHPLETPMALEGKFGTLAEAMKAAERWALAGGIEQREQFERDNPDRLTDAQQADVYTFNAENRGSPDNPPGFFEKPAVDRYAEISESYYAQFAALTESRGGDMDHDASSDGFDVDR